MRALLLLALAACADPAKDDDPAEVPDTDPADTDVVPDTDPGDTDAPGDSDAPAPACPAAVDAALYDCVAALRDEDDWRDASLTDVLLACADPEPVAAAWDAWCAATPADPACALSYEAFVDELLPDCVDRARAVLFADACLFPDFFAEVIVHPGVARLDRRTITDPADLTAIEAEQLVLASGAADLDAALASGPWTSLAVLDVGFDREIVFFTRDTPTGAEGAAFFAGTRFAVARVMEDLVVRCFVDRGIEGQPCATASDCGGRSCFGVVRDEAEQIIAPGACGGDPIEGSGDPCDADAACARGLVCTPFGHLTPDGACAPGWMRRSYRADLGDPSLVTGGELALPVVVSGLASVPVRARLDLTVVQPAANALEVVLRNPLGTESAVGAWSEATVVVLDLGVWSPGDEPVNGAWTLVVRDTGGAAAGTVVDAVLHLDSRFD